MFSTRGKHLDGFQAVSKVSFEFYALNCKTIKVQTKHQKLCEAVSSKHQYNTRFASRLTYYINPARNNFGKFNISFAAAAVWNDLDNNLKQLPPKSFKTKIKQNLIQSYI